MPLLVVLFIVVPIVELFVIIQVGEAIGLWPTVALLLLDSLLGSWLMRQQGRAAWRNFQAATAAGKPPAREAIDGALVIFGGALLLTPGFVSDLLGIALLLPPTRALVRRTLVARLTKRMIAGAQGGGQPRGVRFGTGPFATAGGPDPFGRARRPVDDDVVDSTAHDIDPRELP